MTNLLWPSWGIVINAIVSIIVLLLTDNYEMQCMLQSDLWTEWYQHWIWFNIPLCWLVTIFASGYSVYTCHCCLSRIHIFLVNLYYYYSRKKWNIRNLKDEIATYHSGYNNHFKSCSVHFYRWKKANPSIILLSLSFWPFSLFVIIFIFKFIPKTTRIYSYCYEIIYDFPFLSI